MDKQAVSGTRRALNHFFNPLALRSSDLLTPSDASPGGVALSSGAGKAIGYGTLAFAVHRLLEAKRKAEERKSSDKIKAYAGARFPILSIDPNLEDTAAEEELQSRGVRARDPLPELAKEGTLWNDLLTGNVDPKHLMLNTAGVIGGVAGGWRLADYMSEQRRKKELDTRLASSKNKIDSLLHEEYIRTRGLAPPEVTEPESADEEQIEKAAVDSRQAFEAPSGGSGAAGIVTDTAKNIGGLPNAVGSVGWLWAVAAMAMAHRASKHFSDKHDPNRIRQGELKRVARERALVKSAPTLLDESQLPARVPGTPKPSDKKKQVGSVDVSAGGPPVDKRDPYAGLL